MLRDSGMVGVVFGGGRVTVGWGLTWFGPERERLESPSDGGSHGSAHKLPDESLGGTHGSAHRLRRPHILWLVAVGVKGTNAGALAESIGVRGLLSGGGVTHLGAESMARVARSLRLCKYSTWM